MKSKLIMIQIAQFHFSLNHICLFINLDQNDRNQEGINYFNNLELTTKGNPFFGFTWFPKKMPPPHVCFYLSILLEMATANTVCTINKFFRTPST